MRELGDLAPDEHERLGASIVASGVSLVVSCGGLADRAARSAEALGIEAFCTTGAEEAARLATGLSRPGDITLVKASRSVGAERVVHALIAAQAARPALPRRRADALRAAVFAAP